jgi:hypothetical protein
MFQGINEIYSNHRICIGRNTEFPVDLSKMSHVFKERTAAFSHHGWIRHHHIDCSCYVAREAVHVGVSKVV